ncbi:aminotransferase class III-fold pyridoxal phosphate-dependent enzyme [Herbidospora sp. NEAU-GS84]|uniref:Aminotransferase class III-fold pyridoxal phosphate-dependent enzyme n=1 Tax=Herbidospora solisilvae TaxID=2696284 RepID=A0A7C9NGG0_9ACTN|nr:aminotransferase class III-fold pyridoxal phosphate-dependent enzyme [Herbidospora solisilvae]NAS21832.1 aminotransferase class III-fold pyridoxal phosphate-dependent enzyme [Herbidospora solisilvae]
MTVVSERTPARVLDDLIALQEGAFLARTVESRRVRTECSDVLPGGVASNWQDAPPGAVWISHGQGSRVVDLDGTSYVDLHGGFGVNLVGHAHPAVVETIDERVRKGTHFAQPTRDAVVVARLLAERFGLPMWRFGNSGTEATMDAVHLMRAATGRMKIIKVEGSYHGHHDSVQVSVYPSIEEAGPPLRPRSVRYSVSVPPDLARLTVVVPFGDLEAVERALIENAGEIAGMILEPVMMNIGLIPPPDGYLAQLKDLLHRHGAYLAFDEVKTGLSVAPGGASELLGVTPDLICLAKALGGGLPCGAIGGTPDLMRLISEGVYEQVGTFNGNPLTMAVAAVVLRDVLNSDAYRHFDRLRTVMTDEATAILRKWGMPGYVQSYGAKGSVIFHQKLRDYRDFLDYPDEWGHAHWLYQHNGGVFLPPWGKTEQWTLSVQHSDDDVRRFLTNLDTMGRDYAGSAAIR